MKTRLVGILLLVPAAMLAQSGSVQGTVRDASAAAVPNARVTVTNLETNVSVSALTNQEGLYVAPSLNAGRYKVEANAQGFATQTVPEFRLEVSQTARLDFELEPGTVVETINVSASAVLLNAESTEVGQVIDSKRILEMPLNGRNYLQLALFSVGVLPGGGLGVGARGRDEGQFAAMGMHTNQNNVLLDGNDNSSRTSGGPLGYEAQAVKPPVDAVAEFKVVTNNLAAEYGFRVGAKVLVSTRSGGNQFHGSAYEFLRNWNLDAANFFANRSGASKPVYQQNQYGATLGGRVVKNRTFFFASYQGTRIRVGQTFIQSVPSRDIIERADFSQQPGVRRNIFDPLTLTGTGAQARRSPFAGNIVPATRIDPVVRKLAALYPASNIAGRDNTTDNYYYSPKDSDNADQYDFRGDHNLSEKHRFYARYSYRNQFRNQNGVLPYPAMGGQGQTVDLRGHNVAANLASTFTARLFNELRFGFSAFNTKFDIPFTEDMNAQFGIRNSPQDKLDGPKTGFARFTPSGFAEVGPRSFWPNFNNLDSRLLNDSLLWQLGTHTVKMGGEWRRTNIYRDAARFRRGQMAFSGQFTSEFPNVGTSRGSTGNGFADFLLGWANGGTFGNNQGENLVAPYTGFFVQDDWKISSRLTINYGLRYEVFFRPTFPDPDKQAIGRLNLATLQLEFPKDSGDCGCSNDFNNISPRLGVAYSLGSKTAIRAGSGLFYGEPGSLSTEGGNFRAGPPRSQDIAIQTNFETTNVFVQQGFPAFSNTALQRGADVYIFENFRRNLSAWQWFFDIQRTLPLDTLLTIGYNGTKGTHLFTTRNINQPFTPSATVAANQRLNYPQYNAVTAHDSMLNSSYNALTIKAEKRFSKGFTFLSSFTWAKNIDYANEDLLDGGAGGVTPHDLSRERSLSQLHRKFGYAFSGVYEVPTARMQGMPRAIFGGWQIGAIVSVSTGLPVPHTINVNNKNLGGAVRGDWVRSPNLPSDQRTIDRWFDTGFVVPSAPGVVSNAGRNLIISPGRRNLDVMVSRTFAMPWEGHRLQFRFESFNFTNTPSFGRPAGGVGTPNAGRILDAEDPRRIQFGLKYNF